MKIWLIAIGENLPIKKNIKKERTALLAEKLLERGHYVLWWTSGFNHYKKEWIFNKDTTLNLRENFTIKALCGIGYKKNFSLRRFLDHKIIASKFKKLYEKEEKPDIIVAAFPSYELAYEAVVFGRKNSIPVIVDVRDQWPDIFFNYLPKWTHPIAKLFLYKDFQIARNCLQDATCLVSVMKSMLIWALTKANRTKSPEDRVFYLGKKKIRPITTIKRLSFLKEKIKDKFVVTFIGNFNETYNPLILTTVAKKLANLNIYFILGGDGIYFSQVKKISNELENLILTGWLSEEEIDFIISLSNIGIIPSAGKIEAFPNKAFTYFSGALPVISSVEGDLKELIKKYNLGIYYPPNDINSLSESIKKLYENRNLCEKMSQNVRKIFDRIFDADKIYTEYTEYLEKIVSNKI